MSRIHNFDFVPLEKNIVGKDNVVRDVCVMQTGIAKGHNLIVTEDSLHQFLETVEAQGGQVKTLLNHRSGIENVAGYLQNFYLDGHKLRADLKLLPQQKDFAHTKALIENLSGPGGIGLSASFTGEPSPDGEVNVSSVVSVDLVVNPAVTNGLFSEPFTEDSMNENDEMNDEEIHPEELCELLHSALDHIETLTDHIGELETLLEHLIAEREEEHDDDDAVIEERGAYASGPSRRDMEANFEGDQARVSSLDGCRYDFSARVQAFQGQGQNAKQAHISALKEFARAQYDLRNV